MLSFGFGTFAFFLPERISFTTSVLAVFSRYVIEEALISMYFIAPWTKKIRKIFFLSKIGHEQMTPYTVHSEKSDLWSGFGHHSFNN
jgi:hypothetical protein